MAQVIPIGGDVRQYRIMPDPAMMSRLDISAADIETAIRRFGANTGGGFIDQYAREYLIRNIGLTTRLDDLRNLVVATRQEHSVLLRQVAQVDFAARVKRGDAGFMGGPAVIIGVQKQPAADTITLTRAIEAQLETIQKTLPKGVVANKVQFRQATFIETSIGNVERVLVEAAIVVAAVLLLFLMNICATLISLTAIPTSILVAALVFNAFGLSINTMTLGGLAIAIGALVDDAVVAVENILRRLKENRLNGHTAADPGCDRAGEPGGSLRHLLRNRDHHPGVCPAVRALRYRGRPVPAARGRLHHLDHGVAGDFHHPYPRARLLSAVGATGAGGGGQLRGAPPEGGQHAAPALGLRAPEDLVLHRHRRRAGGRARRHAAAARVPAAVQRRHDPRHSAVQPRHIAGGVEPARGHRRTLSPGHSRGEERRPAHGTRRARRARRRRAQFGARRRSRALGASPEDVYQHIRAKLAVLPVSVSIGQPIAHRLDHMLSGVQAQIVVKVFGENLDALRAQAEALRARLEPIAGLVDLRVEKQVLIPQLKVTPDYERAALYGITPAAFTESLEALSIGRVVSQIIEGNRRFDVVMRVSDEKRSTTGLQELLVSTPKGFVPLRLLAKIEEGEGPNQILRENGQRRIVVAANGDGKRDMAAIVADIRRVIADTQLPSGFTVQLHGNFRAQEEASLVIGLLSLVSGWSRAPAATRPSSS